MTAERLMQALRSDALARLRWCVARRLGLCPASLRVSLWRRRDVLRWACLLLLEGEAAGGESAGANPHFDMARFRALGGGFRT